MVRRNNDGIDWGLVDYRDKGVEIDEMMKDVEREVRKKSKLSKEDSLW